MKTKESCIIDFFNNDYDVKYIQDDYINKSTLNKNLDRYVYIYDMVEYLILNYNDFKDFFYNIIDLILETIEVKNSNGHIV